MICTQCQNLTNKQDINIVANKKYQIPALFFFSREPFTSVLLMEVMLCHWSQGVFEFYYS